MRDTADRVGSVSARRDGVPEEGLVPASFRTPFERRALMFDPSRCLPTQLLDRGVSFLDRKTADTMIQIELCFDGPVDVGRLEHAARLALRVEPILACRFVAHRLAPYWEPADGDDAALFRIAETRDAYDAFKREPILPGQAPRIRICIHDAGARANVTFKVCHLVCDATGTKYVVGLVSRLYRRLASHPGLQPAARRTDRGIAQVLRAIPAAALPRLLAEYRQSQQPDSGIAPAQTLDIAAGEPASLRFLSRTLDRPLVAALRQYAKTREATLNDLLMTGFLRTLAIQSGWDGSRRLSMTSTVDYRRYLPRGSQPAIANLSTTLGGFPDLGHAMGDGFSDTLGRVAAITRRGKQDHLGIGALLATLIALGPMRYGLASGIMQDGMSADIAGKRMENGLGNNGAIDVDDVVLESKPIAARMLPSPFYPPQFVLDVSGYDGTLTLIIGAFAQQQPAAERFLDAIAQAFSACAGPEQAA